MVLKSNVIRNYDEPVMISDTVMLVVLCVIGFFIALIALSMLIKAVKKPKKQEMPAAEPVSAAPASRPATAVMPAASAQKVPAKGSQGELDLFNVDDRTAAMLMAIVADDLKAELNTLRFISIREVQ